MKEYSERKKVVIKRKDEKLKKFVNCLTLRFVNETDEREYKKEIVEDLKGGIRKLGWMSICVDFVLLVYVLIRDLADADSREAYPFTMIYIAIPLHLLANLLLINIHKVFPLIRPFIGSIFIIFLLISFAEYIVAQNQYQIPLG
jgi:hypothetical protein